MDFPASNFIWACDGPPSGVSSSFKKTVRISIDLYVLSVVFCNSRRTRGFASKNLKVKGFSSLLFVLIDFLSRRRQCFVLSGDGDSVQQTCDKSSQLIEIIRSR